jgi:hypothetical protein
MAEPGGDTRRCRVREEPGRIIVTLDGQDRLVLPLDLTHRPTRSPGASRSA